MKYPAVVDEWATLEKVLQGHSIARYGDGELKLMQGRRCVSQLAVAGISDELRAIAAGQTTALVGVPTLDTRSPKFLLWNNMTPKFAPYLNPKGVYYSSFITRPDSAPWLAVPEYFDKLESLWKDQTVTFVGNGVRSLTPKFLLGTGARQVDWVECSYAHSYVQIEYLMERVTSINNHRVLLCAGATATCMAERLAKRGYHAIDLGHIGMYWRRYGEKLLQILEQREINKETGLVEPNP